jgi:hypothetical protein
MSDHPKDQVTTDERAAIREELRDEIRAESRSAHPAESTEEMRRVVRAEARPLIAAAVSKHATDCEHEGPLHTMVEHLGKKVDIMDTRASQRMDKMENRQADDWKEFLLVQAALNKYLGERDFKRWFVPIVASMVGSSLAAAIVMFVLKHFLFRMPQ